MIVKNILAGFSRMFLPMRPEMTWPQQVLPPRLSGHCPTAGVGRETETGGGAALEFGYPAGEVNMKKMVVVGNVVDEGLLYYARVCKSFCS